MSACRASPPTRLAAVHAAQLTRVLSERPRLAGRTGRGATSPVQAAAPYQRTNIGGGLMCDQDTLNDMMEYELKAGGMSRRQFGALTLGAGLMSMLPPVAGAAEVTDAEVNVKTPDGTCDAYFVHPVKGATAAVLVW